MRNARKSILWVTTPVRIVLKFLLSLVGLHTNGEFNALVEENHRMANDYAKRLGDMDDKMRELMAILDQEKKDHISDTNTYVKMITERDTKITDLNEVVVAARSEAADKKALQTAFDAARSHSEELSAEAAKLRDDNRRLKISLDLSRKAPDNNAEYMKTLQTQLNAAISNSEAFEFRNSVPIPGSVSMIGGNARLSDDGTATVVRFRAIATDQMTAQINAATDMTTKVNVVVSHLRSTGFLSRMAETFLKSGAVSLILAYNENCTNYVLYGETALVNRSGGEDIVTILSPDQIYNQAPSMYYDDLGNLR